MLKKVYRLGKMVKLTKGKNYNGHFFTLRIAKNRLFYNRFAFVVSKKVDKRAVIRNKTKRKLSLCIEKMFSEIKIGYDIIFFAKKTAAFQEFEGLCSEVSASLKNEGLLK